MEDLSSIRLYGISFMPVITIIVEFGHQLRGR